MSRGNRITADKYDKIKELINAGLNNQQVAKFAECSTHSAGRVRKTRDYKDYLATYNGPRQPKAPVQAQLPMANMPLEDLFVYVERVEAKIDRVLKMLELRVEKKSRRLF